MSVVPDADVTTVPAVVERENDGVSVVQDSTEYLRHIQNSKGRDAKWVRGLSPEDEESERATMRVREELAAATEERAWMASESAADRKAKRWLRRPLLLAIFYLVTMLLTYRSEEGFAEMMLLDFPESEERAWSLARRRGENAVNFVLRVGLALAIPSGVMAASAGWLCFLLGTAAHHFTALCGVGTAMLSILAMGSQALILWACCGASDVSGRWECDLPFVLYWVCSVIRVGGPMLALWCAGPVMDIARNSHHLKYLLGVPAAILAAAVLLTCRNDKPATRLLQLSHEVSMAVWAYFICLCWYQPNFTVVLRNVKTHVD